MKADQPSIDCDAERLALAECLLMDPEHLERLIEVFSEVLPLQHDNSWSAHDHNAQTGVIIARAAGLPHDPTRHQQPYDVARLVRMLAPIHSDSVDDIEELRASRLAHALIVCRFEEWFSLLPFAEAISRTKTAGILLLQRFGPGAPTEVRSRLLEFCAVLEWFTDTEGLHDPKSGDVDVDAAALRKYRKGGRA